MGEARERTRDAVVRPLSRAAVRPCARPGCPSPARATLSFRYATREAWLGALGEDPAPSDYDLCAAHADRTQPPHGWRIVDRRPEDDDAGGSARGDGPMRDLGGEHTVAVLAAALRAVPDEPLGARDEDGPRDGGQGPAPSTVVVDDEVRDALAELQAVAQGEAGDAERLPSSDDDDPSAADGDDADAAAHVEALFSAAEAHEAHEAHEAPPRPRPVPAARERHREAPGGPARAW